MGETTTSTVREVDHAEAYQTVLQDAAFQQLGLTPEELTEIKRQGFINREDRGGGRVIFKLRFRLRGRQRVKYLGADVARATLIEQQLTRMRHSRCLDKTLRQLNHTARKLMQELKPRLEPLISQAGLHFHGRTIRRLRALAGQTPVPDVSPNDRPR